MPSAGRSASAEASLAGHAERDGSLGYLVKTAHRVFTRALQKRLKPHGVTLAQWYFLRELWSRDGLTQRELSRRLDVSEPTTAAAITLMMRRKLVERRRENGDLRTFHVYLTPRGLALRRSLLDDGLIVNQEATLGVAEDDVTRLKLLLVQIIANLEKPSLEKPGLDKPSLDKR